MTTQKITPHDEIRTVLIISPDNEMAGALEGLFNRNRYFVVNESRADHALQTAGLLKPSLIIFNLEPHQQEHITLCRKLRTVTTGAILLLAPREEDAHGFEYYQAGVVDEHIPTPVNPLVLLVRSMSWLVRQQYIPARAESMLHYA